MVFKNGDRVRVHYTGRLEDGREFDSTLHREPIEFVIGSGELLPAFERAVLGHGPGETVVVAIPAEEAYGEVDPGLFFTVSRAQMPAHIPLREGIALQLSNGHGQMDVLISRVGPDEVTLDGNHPLAGHDLTFEIEILNSRRS